jgi:hypothetical protein
MDERVVEKRTTIRSDEPGQATNVNVNPDGSADVQVDEDAPAGETEVVRERTVERRTP